MSQQDVILPQGSLPGGVGLSQTASSNSISNSVSLAAEISSNQSKPICAMTNSPQDIQGTHDGTTSPTMVMPAAAALARMDGTNSNSSFVKLPAEHINGVSKPTNPLVAHSGKKITRPNPGSPVVAVSADNKNKAEGKNKLDGAVGGGEDVAGGGCSIIWSNTMSSRSSLDTSAQDDVKDSAKPISKGGGGSGNVKGKGVVAEANNSPRLMAERERRQKMKDMYNTLHSLLPQLPDKADKASIVGEAADYIKTLEGTLKRLEKLKEERMRAQQQLGAGSSAAPAPPQMGDGCTQAPATMESALANVVQNRNTQQQAVGAVATGSAVGGAFQTWSAPNIVMSFTGNDAFISVCVPRQRNVMTAILYALEKYGIDVVTGNISSDQNRSMICIQAHVNPTSDGSSNCFMTAQDRFKKAMSMMQQWITNTN